MVNKRKLKAAILIHDGTQKNLAEALGISLSNLSLRINGHMEFKAGEIAFIRDRYGLSEKDVCEIFFAENVS